MAHELVVKGGRVIDSTSGLDKVTDVAFAGGQVAELGDRLTGEQTYDASGQIVTPGLIDLHAHVYWGGTSLGIEADDFAVKSATTTFVDTGSAGPGNFAGFLRHVIEPAQTRILAYLHISFAGIFAFSPTIMVGESREAGLMAPAEAVDVAKANPDVVVGIKVRVGRHTSGANGIAPLDIALQAAGQCGLPIMAHIDEPPPSYDDVVDKLRAGDTLTHCFRPFPNSPLGGDGKVREAILRARERGVAFDIGHGMGSFDWASAIPMVKQGFHPDTISSDIHTLCINGPAWTLLRTMNKLMAIGMSLEEVVQATTVNPAKAVGRPELGRLSAGGIGDASIFEVQDKPIKLEDVKGVTVTGKQTLVARAIVRSGQLTQA